jgi:voltage-gated potassium channel
MMFSSLLNPGATSLIETLLDIETGIQKVKVRELGSYKTFGEIIKIVRKDGYLPIAVERSKKIILNPEDDFEIQESDAIFLIPKGEYQ